MTDVLKKYDDGHWFDRANRAGGGAPDETAELISRMDRLDAELTVLIAIISETCRMAEMAHQTMPPVLAKWWEAHKK